MLDRAGFPLSNAQLSNFFLQQDYTDYFRIQEVIGNLVDSKLILATTSHAKTQNSLTVSVRETLSLLCDKINDSIVEDVRNYFDANKWEFRLENAVIANYHLIRHQRYAVSCQVKNDGESTIDLTLTVRSKEQAEAICSHWKQKHEEVYAYLMDTLMS
jgi:hypothetical protein